MKVIIIRELMENKTERNINLKEMIKMDKNR